MKVKSESEVAQSCPTLRDPMDCSPPGSSVHGTFQARALEWGAIAFSAPTLSGGLFTTNATLEAHTMKYYSLYKMKESLLFATAYIDLEDIVLMKYTRQKKQILHALTYMRKL